MNIGLHCLFADDIRNEVGNKTSLMGVYGRNIGVAEFPATLPRLWISSRISIMGNQTFGAVGLKFMFGGVLLSQHDVSPEFLDSFFADMGRAVAAEELGPEDVVTLVLNAMVSPLNLEAPGVLEVFITVDGNERRAGQIRVVPASTIPVSNSV